MIITITITITVIIIIIVNICRSVLLVVLETEAQHGPARTYTASVAMIVIVTQQWRCKP